MDEQLLYKTTIYDGQISVVIDSYFMIMDVYYTLMDNYFMIMDVYYIPMDNYFMIMDVYYIPMDNYFMIMDVYYIPMDNYFTIMDIYSQFLQTHLQSLVPDAILLFSLKQVFQTCYDDKQDEVILEILVVQTGCHPNPIAQGDQNNPIIIR